MSRIYPVTSLPPKWIAWAYRSLQSPKKQVCALCRLLSLLRKLLGPYWSLPLLAARFTVSISCCHVSPPRRLVSLLGLSLCADDAISLSSSSPS